MAYEQVIGLLFLVASLSFIAGIVFSNFVNARPPHR
jgi:hypothetical protein